MKKHATVLHSEQQQSLRDNPQLLQQLSKAKEDELATAHLGQYQPMYKRYLRDLRARAIDHNFPNFRTVEQPTSQKGISTVGEQVRQAIGTADPQLRAQTKAKNIVAQTMRYSQLSPKPNLPKSELDKADIVDFKTGKTLATHDEVNKPKTLKDILSPTNIDPILQPKGHRHYWKVASNYFGAQEGTPEHKMYEEELKRHPYHRTAIIQKSEESMNKQEIHELIKKEIMVGDLNKADIIDFKTGKTLAAHDEAQTSKQFIPQTLESQNKLLQPHGFNDYNYEKMAEEIANRPQLEDTSKVPRKASFMLKPVQRKKALAGLFDELNLKQMWFQNDAFDHLRTNSDTPKEHITEILRHPYIEDKHYITPGVVASIVNHPSFSKEHWDIINNHHGQRSYNDYDNGDQVNKLLLNIGSKKLNGTPLNSDDQHILDTILKENNPHLLRHRGHGFLMSSLRQPQYLSYDSPDLKQEQQKRWAALPWYKKLTSKKPAWYKSEQNMNSDEIHELIKKEIMTMDLNKAGIWERTSHTQDKPIDQSQKGVHRQARPSISGEVFSSTKPSGFSHAGLEQRKSPNFKDPTRIKEQHQKIFNELMAMPKPNLPKSEILEGGKADNMSDSKFDPKEMKEGIKDEHEEHGGSNKVSKEITKDHLKKDPKYYSHMKERGMEKADIKDSKQNITKVPPQTTKETKYIAINGQKRPITVIKPIQINKSEIHELVKSEIMGDILQKGIIDKIKSAAQWVGHQTMADARTIGKVISHPKKAKSYLRGRLYRYFNEKAQPPQSNLPKSEDKVATVMREFHHGTLHSGSGHKVTDKAQAAAIGYSEARKAKKAELDKADIIDLKTGKTLATHEQVNKLKSKLKSKTNIKQPDKLRTGWGEMLTEGTPEYDEYQKNKAIYKPYRKTEEMDKAEFEHDHVFGGKCSCGAKLVSSHPHKNDYARNCLGCNKPLKMKYLGSFSDDSVRKLTSKGATDGK